MNHAHDEQGPYNDETYGAFFFACLADFAREVMDPRCAGAPDPPFQKPRETLGVIRESI